MGESRPEHVRPPSEGTYLTKEDVERLFDARDRQRRDIQAEVDRRQAEADRQADTTWGRVKTWAASTVTAAIVAVAITLGVPHSTPESVVSPPVATVQTYQTPETQTPVETAGSQLVNRTAADPLYTKVLLAAFEGVTGHAATHWVAIALKRAVPKNKKEQNYKDCIEELKIEVDTKIATEITAKTYDADAMSEFVSSGLKECAQVLK